MILEDEKKKAILKTLKESARKKNFCNTCNVVSRWICYNGYISLYKRY